jgi:hypothetical protein
MADARAMIRRDRLTMDTDIRQHTNVLLFFRKRSLGYTASQSHASQSSNNRTNLKNVHAGRALLAKRIAAKQRL